MEENKDLFPGEASSESVVPPVEASSNNKIVEPETAPPAEPSQMEENPVEPETKSDYENNDSEKPSAGSAITVVIIIVLVALGIWYFNRNEAKPETNPGTSEANITVDDSQEQGKVTIIGQDDNGKIAQIASTTVKITAYYSNIKKDPDIVDCSRVYPLEREVEKKYEQMEINTVKGLLFSLTEAEKAAGWVSSVPAGVTLKSIKIDGNTAVVDFGSALSEAAGSCTVISIRSQIENTMKQFKYVKDVVICIEGDCKQDQILQP
ncbi:MAG: GerMN domain-containing protein [Patescibacteria group bacterium]